MFGGIAIYAGMAGVDGSPAHNYAVAATLVFVAAGAWHARRRRVR